MNKRNKIGLNQVTDTINMWLETDKNIVKNFDLSNALELLWDRQKQQGRISYAQNSYLRYQIDQKNYFGGGGVNDLLQQFGFRKKVEPSGVEECSLQEPIGMCKSVIL